MKCLRCSRELTKPGQTIGEYCKKKMLKDEASGAKPVRVEALTTARNYHSYLIFSSPKRMIVKIYISPTGEKTADCECQSRAICEHIAAAIDRENVRFPKTQTATAPIGAALVA